MSFTPAGHSDSFGAKNETVSSIGSGKQAMDMSGSCDIGIQNNSGKLRKCRK